MTASKSIKTPVMTLPLLADKTKEDAEALASRMRRIRLAEVTKTFAQGRRSTAHIDNFVFSKLNAGSKSNLAWPNCIFACSILCVFLIRDSNIARKDAPVTTNPLSSRDFETNPSAKATVSQENNH